MNLDSYFALLQEEALPGIWSRGLALARDRAVILESSPAEGEQGGEHEYRLRVKTPGRTVSPSVTLWPEDEDAHCDCGDKAEPCMHIVAAAVALKNGWAQKLETEARPRHPQLRYQLQDRDGALGFVRVIVFPSGESRPLRESLVSFVGGISSGRIAAPELPTTKLDYRVDQVLTQLGARGWIAPSGQLDARAIEPLFDALKELPVLHFEDEPVRVSGQPLKPGALLEDSPRGGVRLRLRQGADTSEGEKEPRVFSNGAILRGGLLRPLLSLPLAITEADGREFTERDYPLLVSKLLPLLERESELTVTATRLPRLERISPRILLETARAGARDDEGLEVMARLVYGEPPLAEVIEGKFEMISGPGSRVVPVRDETAEQVLLRELQTELHLKPRNRVRWAGTEAVDFMRRARRWQPEGAAKRDFEVRGRLEPEISADATGLRIRFALNGSGSGSATADAERVITAWRQRDRLAPLLEGGWAEIPAEWINRHIERLEPLLALKNSKPTVLQQVQIAEFCSESGGAISADLAAIRDRLLHQEGIPESRLPSDLRAELRPYQHKGVQWLRYLRGLGLGALLADDMGLGKTLQTLCALEGRALIVVPTSVLPSWEEQIRQFRPALRVSKYYGPGRRLEPHADVTLTSYGVLRMDRALLTADQWDTVVLDEAQAIKNPDSQLAKVAHQLRGRFKIALTGTPIENRLEDLWSQFQFVQPGLLGTRDDFRQNLALGIEGSFGVDLKRRTRPLILRRMKSEVAPELPPKIETLLYCDLSEAEQSAYRTILAATQDTIVQELESGIGGSLLHALEALLRLRQVCADPALVPGLVAPESLDRVSSKLELLRETVEESLDLGHCVLIFSQWTSLLDRMEPVIHSLVGTDYLRLDGATRDRAAVISAFQREDGPRVMLLSLKAGGVGVTLTRADHVIIADPWWNPAVEDQAADRAHRIGQDKTVLVQRLVARDTVEEKILALKKKKQELADAILGSTPGPGATPGRSATLGDLQLTREDLLELLR